MILVTGRYSKLYRQRAINIKSAGYSLLELLVVLTIIGTMTAIVALSFRGSSADPAEEVLRKLRFSVELAGNEAIIRSELLGLTLSTEGYFFSRLEEPNQENSRDTFNSFGGFSSQSDGVQRWVKIEKDRLLKPYTLNDGLSVAVYQQTERLSLPAGLDSLNDPQIIFLPSGEVTPFEYQITYQDNEPLIERFDGLGRVIKPTEKDPEL